MDFLGVFRCTDVLSELWMLKKIEEIQSVRVSAIIIIKSVIMHILHRTISTLTLQSVHILAFSNTEGIQDTV